MTKLEESGDRKMFLPPSVQHLFAGGCGGASIIIVGHPLDTVKVRLQTMPQPLPGAKPMFTGAWNCAHQTIKREGFFSLYRGMLAPLAISMPTAALNFWAFNKGKSMQLHGDGTVDSKDLKPYQVFLAGAFTGVTSQILVVPGERMKCLLQIQRQSKGKNKYRGPFDCIKHIYREEGLRGVYRGTGVGLLRDIPGLGMFFMSYECIMRVLTPDGQSRETVGPVAIALAGGLAGINFWLVALPQDVLKSRYQTAPAGMYPRGMRDVFQFTVQKEGYRALWRGLTPVMIRAFPACSAVYLGYEFGLRFLHWSVPHLVDFGSGIFFD